MTVAMPKSSCTLVVGECCHQELSLLVLFDNAIMLQTEKTPFEHCKHLLFESAESFHGDLFQLLDRGCARCFEALQIDRNVETLVAFVVTVCRHL